jgi:hypothetical protein
LLLVVEVEAGFKVVAVARVDYLPQHLSLLLMARVIAA